MLTSVQHFCCNGMKYVIFIHAGVFLRCSLPYLMAIKGHKNANISCPFTEMESNLEKIRHEISVLGSGVCVAMQLDLICQ